MAVLIIASNPATAPIAKGIPAPKGKSAKDPNILAIEAANETVAKVDKTPTNAVAAALFEAKNPAADANPSKNGANAVPKSAIIP